LDEATKQELKTEIKSNSDYLLSIISDIMEISQIESGNRKAQIASFNLPQLLENIYHEQGRNCPHGIRFTNHINLPDGFTVHSDKNLLKQIMERFIGNAFKFTGKGEVEMGCKLIESKKLIEFYVKDVGIGIPAHHLEEIFEPFLQLNSMMKGVGIGLTICREHASMLKSKIQVESEQGRGSVFSFRIK